MSYPRKRRGDDDILIKGMKFIQWAHYRGGIPLVFICVGIFLIFALCILTAMGLKMNYVVLSISAVITGIGFLMLYLQQRRP